LVNLERLLVAGGSQSRRPRCVLLEKQLQRKAIAKKYTPNAKLRFKKLHVTVVAL
jgi:hypothetical protein